jgi:hypothetical protein
MAVFNFSALAHGERISFNPNEDVLNFDQTTIAAADIRVTVAGASGTSFPRRACSSIASSSTARAAATWASIPNFRPAPRRSCACG